jgi:hypothetical protein
MSKTKYATVNALRKIRNEIKNEIKIFRKELEALRIEVHGAADSARSAGQSADTALYIANKYR